MALLSSPEAMGTSLTWCPQILGQWHRSQIPVPTTLGFISTASGTPRQCFLNYRKCLSEMSSEPRSTWPPEGLGWPGLCTLTCLTGMPVGDQVSKPKRHCFRPPGWGGQEQPLDSQYPGFRVNTRSSRVTTQVNQPQGATPGDGQEALNTGGPHRERARGTGFTRALVVATLLPPQSPTNSALSLPAHPTLRADPSST